VRLERAEKALRDFEYQKLRPTLEDMLVPEPRFDTRDDRLRARTLYMIGLFFEQQTGSLDVTIPSTIRQQALALLREEPSYELDNNIVPRGLITIIDEVREENKDELDRLEQVDAPKGQQQLTVTYNRNPFIVNFLPMGLPQFLNGQEVKGTLFAVGQTAALGTNVTFWMVHRSIVRQNDFDIARQDVETQTQLRNLTIGIYAALGVTAALYIYSVIDGTRNFQEQTLFSEELTEVGEGAPRGPTNLAPSPLRMVPEAPLLFEWTWRF